MYTYQAWPPRDFSVKIVIIQHNGFKIFCRLEAVCIFKVDGTAQWLRALTALTEDRSLVSSALVCNYL